MLFRDRRDAGLGVRLAHFARRSVVVVPESVRDLNSPAAHAVERRSS
jgi:hypothetical protein